MAKAQRFQDLQAWQKAHSLALMVYEVTKDFPQDERFGLTSQVQRAAVSVGSNIAEGWGRQSRPDFVRFLKIARGSCYEIQSQLLLAADLHYLSHDHAVFATIGDTERLLCGLIRSIENKDKSS